VKTRERWLLAAAIAYGLLFWLFRRHTMDDAYIGFTYVRNVLRGNGFVFYAAPPVEGVSNLGWLIAILPLAALVGPPASAKIIGALSGFATLGLTYRIARPALDADQRRWALPFVLLATATSFDFVFFTAAAMETSLLALLFLASVALFAMGRRTGAAAVLLAAYLVHPEAIAVFPLMVACSPGRRDALRGLVLLVVGVVVITALRHAYFGALVPNTFFAKPGSASQTIQNVKELTRMGPSNLSEPFAHTVLLLPLVLGAIRLVRRRRALGGAVTSVVLVGLAFALYSKLDWTGTGRYFAPYVPCAFILYALGVIGVAKWIARRTRIVARLWTFGLVALALALPLRQLWRFQTTGWNSHPGFVMTGESLVEPAMWLRNHLPPGSVVASRRIGALSYVSALHVFDFKYGLTEPGIARIIFDTKQWPLLGRSPALDTIWRDVHPDYILEDDRALPEFRSPIDRKDGSLKVLGERFVRVTSFSVSTDRNWVLLRRADLPAP
jgi:hypothetical protein